MADYKEILNPFLKDIEGSSELPYNDSKGISTVGHGFNLDDEENQGIFQMHGIDPNEVKKGNRSIASDEADSIKDTILNRKERLVRDKVGTDLFDGLTPNKKATLMSLGYQSLNNLGPNLQQSISSGDDIAAMQELILNTNADNDPGILKRRLKEAELYNPDPVSLSSAFKLMDNEQKKKLSEIINKVKNENTKKEMLDKYGGYLGQKSEPLKMPKLKDYFKKD